MRIRYSPRATEDIASIFEYLAERSPRGAANVMAAIFAAVEFVRRNPQAMAPIRNIPDVRAIVVQRFRFKIFYRVLPSHNVVEIVHIRHTSRRPWSGESR